jgi:ABC-type nickel/cobalt efflux system permease component RcnA
LAAGSVIVSLVRRLALGWLLCLPAAAGAHPMGNFAICHYARLTPSAGRLAIHYLLDFAEMPAADELPLLDRDRRDYLRRAQASLAEGLDVTCDGQPLKLEAGGADAVESPGAGGLRTLRLICDWRAPLPERPRLEIAYQDNNYLERVGWKEVVATAGEGTALTQSDVPAADLSAELTVYPPDAPGPGRTDAHFTVVPGAGGPAPPTVADGTPSHRGNAFTDSITIGHLTPWTVVLALLAAFWLGAAHGLTPGHGKTLAAAYLVGSRGTARHAVLLGLTVTVSHMLGVYGVGLVALLASRYVVPERLYPWLGLASGLLVVGVGLAMLRSRWRAWRAEADHRRAHELQEEHGHHHHGGGSDHHHDLPDEIRLGSLLALGVSGGLVPCPDALVVMLAAVALGRTVFGLLLITAFSLGLAGVLVAVGLLVVRARPWIERRGGGGRRLSWLPIVAAGAVTLIGLALAIVAAGPVLGKQTPRGATGGLLPVLPPPRRTALATSCQWHPREDLAGVAQSPKRGQRSATGQRSQAGRWALQHLRPCQTRLWPASIQRFRGSTAIRSRSILTGSPAALSPRRPLSRATWVSTTTPTAMP